MKLEESLQMHIKCHIPYVGNKQLRRANMPTHITLGQALALTNTLNEFTPKSSSSCQPSGLMINTEFALNAQQECYLISGCVEIMGLCGIQHCKCDPSFQASSDFQDPRQRTRFCFNKLSTGHCCDSYIRDSVGCTLFPALYQKTK